MIICMYMFQIKYDVLCTKLCEPISRELSAKIQQKSKFSNIKSVLKSQHNLFFPFFRGVKRMGQASSDNTGRLTDWSSDALNRLGELASHGAATIGGLATQASDVALAVPTAISDAALAVPKSLSTFSNDKKMRDCLLQAMCYISTPFIDPNSNYVKRR